MDSPGNSAPPKSRRSMLTITLALGCVLAPVAMVVGLPQLVSPGAPLTLHESPVAKFPATSLRFDRVSLGSQDGFRPQITNVRITDLDQDGTPDVLVCDARKMRVLWYRPRANGGWDEVPLGDELNVPAGAIPVDVDGDGDLDVVVAVLGRVYPTDDRIGQVMLLENRDGKFVNRVLLDDLRRVSDVQAGDFDGDGDMDLAVAVFGYHHGEILWLENRGGGQFRDHQLMVTEGPSHVPVGDFDGDGDVDIVALVSQDHEEVWAFENKGRGEFSPRRIFASANFDLGSAGLIAADLDRDGDLDFILSAGDNLEITHHYPQPWHGCIWLENQGGWTFTPRRIATVGGVYAAAVADFDGDGDNDIAAACMFNDWGQPGAASLVLMENDGHQQFTPKTLADHPISLATIAAGDLNRDGFPDVVAGALNLIDAPPSRTGRLFAWMNRTGGSK